MTYYESDGKRLLHVEYDAQPQVGDMLDGLRIMSVHEKSADEYGVFVLEHSGMVGVYVFDETYIVGHVSGFETLNDAVSAWMADEI